MLPLASKNTSSRTADWRDVTGNLVAFEAINGVFLEIRMMTADYHGRADLSVVVVAHDRKEPVGDLPPLASVRVTCSGIRLKSLEGALIHALYLLDSRLAERELDTEALK